MKINRFIFFIISLSISLASSVLLTFSYEQMILDPEYVKSLNLPMDGDSMGIPLAASAIVSMLFILFNICLHILIFILCLTILKDKKVTIKSLLFQRDELGLNIVRVIGCLIIGLMVVSYSLSFFKFYLLEFLFYVATILAIIAYGLWITTIIKKEN